MKNQPTTQECIDMNNNGEYSMRFDEHFIRGALSEVVITGVFPENAPFSIDTRTLRAGDIFVALPGVRVDGHSFIPQALEQGAAGVMLASQYHSLLDTLPLQQRKKIVLIEVPDTLQALLRLATVWRAQFDIPVIAVTGSVGKTSTKELLARILALNGTNCLVAHGNQNTKIGIALNILRMRAHHQMALFEVGISKRGEMAELAALLKPTTGIITAIGHCHMEGLGSLADIALEKRDLFKYFSEKSIGIINGDQSLLTNVGYAHPVIKFGSKTVNQIQARKIHVGHKNITFSLKIYKDKFAITLGHVHEGAVFNSLAAAAAAHLLGVSNEVIVKAIEQPITVPGRFEHIQLPDNKGVLINDCYNANPESMKAALLAFQKIETRAQKIAVLGDMLELGLNSPFWHRQLGRFLRKVPSLRHVILVGDLVKWTKKTVPVGVTVEIVPTWQEAVAQLQHRLDQDSLVLVKGSNGVGLKHLVAAVTPKTS
jgi:UDP-N-acetylmuramoyl-tripeptide--D-alanyl-D-alanine ligase